jgi:hypothetical protein
MANPITAIASRSCAKNTALKQTKDDLSKGSSTTEVSTTTDIPIATASGSDIYGSQTDTTITSPGSEAIPEVRKTVLYSDLPEDQREAARKYNMDTYGTHNPTAEVEGVDNTVVTQEAVPAVEPTEKKLDPEQTPQYESAQGMSTFDTRKDFRRQKIAERLSGKSEKQAKRYARRAERLRKRGKDEKAGIFDRKSEMSSNRAENLRDRLDQFKIQQDQGGSGTSQYQTIKVRENIDAAKEKLKDNSTQFTGNDPSDFQKIGKSVANIASDIKEKGLGAAKDVGSLVSNFLGAAPKKTMLKKNYFNK